MIGNLHHRIVSGLIFFGLIFFNISFSILAFAAENKKTADRQKNQKVAAGKAILSQEVAKIDKTILRRIEASLNAIKSLKSAFIQRAADGSLLKGILYLQRPGKLRFDFGKTAPFLVVSNGRMLSFIDYEIKQVSRWPIGKTPLGILVEDNITFNDRIEISHMVRFAGLVKLSVIDPERREYGHITLIFEESNMALKAWEVVDNQGYITYVELINPHYNMAIDDEKFTFKDPRPRKYGPRK